MSAADGGHTLLQALRAQLDTGRSRLHMPGHKGRLAFPLEEAARWDLTELPGTDSLYEADGCLLRLEERFAALYGAGYTALSAGGSTLCLQAMLALAGAGAAVLCDRGLHAAALSAMGLLGQEPVWVRGEAGAADGLPRPPAPSAVRAALARRPDVKAVYITSPNYYGFTADIAGAAAAAHEAGAALLVDNAHGAHLRFTRPGTHPLAAGADACCDSLHKTLPALTGAALLHLAPGSRFDARRVKTCMSWFGSTSPSYLILLSADMLAGALAGALPDELQRLAGRVSDLLCAAEENGRLVARGSGGRFDPLRVTLPLRGVLPDPAAMRRLLYEHKIEPELCDPLAAVLLCSPGTDSSAFARLRALLLALPPPREAPPPAPLPGLPRRAMSVRAAMLAPSERVPVRNAAGRVAAARVSHCPPGVPLLVCGEILEREAAFLLESYGINEIDVVK